MEERKHAKTKRPLTSPVRRAISTANEPPHKLQWQKLSRSNGGRQPNAICAGGSERDRASEAQAERRDRGIFGTMIRGATQRGPERGAQTAESITQARRHSTQTLPRPWGTTTVTRWGLLSGLNHCVVWCLETRNWWETLKLSTSGILRLCFPLSNTELASFSKFRQLERPA